MASPLLAIGLLAGLITIALTGFVRTGFRIRRERRFRGLELRPNCLLTRYPIIFLSKQKKFFQFTEEWQDVPKYLREHGYDVFILSAHPTEPHSSVARELATFPTKCHLIAGARHEDLLESVAAERHPKIASLTLVKSAKTPNLSPEDLRPGLRGFEVFEPVPDSPLPSWAKEAKFLDYAISLAERDAEWCD